MKTKAEMGASASTEYQQTMKGWEEAWNIPLRMSWTEGILVRRPLTSILQMINICCLDTWAQGFCYSS